jgi:tripartite-type tricarboxylate transporter receptor subunit TctC
MSRLILAALLILGLMSPITAQEAWPAQKIVIVCPFPAGVIPDAIARILADQLSLRLKQSIVVENRIGAGGTIGTEYAALARNDGYTLFLGSFDTQAIVGHVYKRIPNPVTAFAPISLLGRIYNVVAATPTLDINSITDLASNKDRAVTYATPGIGTSLHLLGEMIKQRTGTNLVHVPYRNSQDGINDVMTGRVNLTILGLPLIAGLIKEKKLKALVNTAPRRLAAFPNMPTMTDQGYPELSTINWFGLLAPAGTSPEIINKLNAEIQDIVKGNAYRSRLEALLIEPVGMSVQEFTDYIKSESDRMGPIVEKAQITLH